MRSFKAIDFEVEDRNRKWKMNWCKGQICNANQKDDKLFCGICQTLTPCVIFFHLHFSILYRSLYRSLTVSAIFWFFNRTFHIIIPWWLAIEPAIVDCHLDSTTNTLNPHGWHWHWLTLLNLAMTGMIDAFGLNRRTHCWLWQLARIHLISQKTLLIIKNQKIPFSPTIEGRFCVNSLLF